MKKLIAAFTAMVLLCSCSGDDDQSNGNNTLPELASTTETIYSTKYLVDPSNPVGPGIPDGFYVNQKMITQFDNGRPVSRNIYTGQDGYFNSYEQFTYNSNGLIEKILWHTNATGEERTTTLSYDIQGRMTEAVLESSTIDGPYITYTFAYNDDNTITRTRTFQEGGAETSTFFVNAAGQLYKEIVDGTTVEYTYSGNDTMSATATWGTGSQTRTFLYDTEHNPSLMGLESITGNYQPNKRFIRDFWYYVDETTMIAADHYITKHQRSSADIINVTYTFNDNGQPASRKAEVEYAPSGYNEVLYTYSE